MHAMMNLFHTRLGIRGTSCRRHLGLRTHHHATYQTRGHTAKMSHQQPDGARRFFYKQVNGAAMGHPLCVALSYIYLWKKVALSLIVLRKWRHKIEFMQHLVDDKFIIANMTRNEALDFTCMRPPPAPFLLRQSSLRKHRCSYAVRLRSGHQISCWFYL